MPLIIGNLIATIDISGGAPPAALPPQRGELVDEEQRSARALAAARLEAERKVDQRDPDRLGGQ
jgi:hypothetical protein